MNDAEQCADELEVLRAIYPDDGAFVDGDFVELVKMGEAAPAVLYGGVITLRRLEDDPLTGPAIALAFVQPPGYPSSAPVWLALKAVRGLGAVGAAALASDLEVVLRRRAEECVGEVAVYGLSVEVLEWLEAWVEEYGVAAEEEAEEEQEEQEEEEHQCRLSTCSQ